MQSHFVQNNSQSVLTPSPTIAHNHPIAQRLSRDAWRYAPMDMDYDEAVDAVRGKLFDLICEGGGDGETINRYAEQIASMFVQEFDA